MRKLVSALAFSTASAFSVGAYAQSPSTESVERLLAITKADSMVDGLYAAMEPMMKRMMQMPAGKAPTPEQQKMLEGLPARFTKLMREEMSWAQMKPDMLRIYQESFEQPEIDGMIAFYESPAGKATLNKMPIVMQKSMEFSQQRMQSMMPKLMKLMEDAAREGGVKR